ncbi:choice-of-anchor D domain-containing protein [Corallococcus sp. CA047B]|uniref:choice-of-anchor D domain-containing protein n=1 Tax=Corallococcus sp. CA047B TaxID=2316729 RepID=UPI000EA24110|nr:choice-of-anchor D domain-containing protein [Corallococcus sp. CA047B]RKH04531.1 choice-of-anchor D domain-containing protein [Corallococcus sp. CA047B]
MNRFLLILTASLCVLTACGPDPEKPPEPGTLKARIAAPVEPLDARVQGPGTGAQLADPEPPLELSDTALGFIGKDACTPDEGMVELRNPATTDRKINRVSITGGFTFAGLYKTPNVPCALPCTVPAMPVGNEDPIEVRVGFSRLQPGTFHGALTLYTDDPNTPSLTVTLDGESTGPLLVLGQTSVVFGAHEVGSAPTRSVTVVNLGNEEFSQTPSATPPFSVPNAPLTIPALGTGTLVVTFNPIAKGAFAGVLNLANSSVCPAPPVALLSGEAVSPAKLVLSRTVMAFPQTTVNTVSAPQEVTVRNDGGSLLTVTQLTLAQDSLFQVDPSGPFSLAPGDTQRLKLTFHPSDPGNASDELLFASNDSTAPNLPLTGTATPGASPAKLVLSRTVMAFPQTTVNTPSAAQEITVKNDGGSLLTVSALGLQQPANTPYYVDTSAPFSLAPGDTQVLKLTFTPRVAGSASATLSFTSNSSPAAPSVTLSGTGAPAAPTAGLVLNRDAVDFGTPNACTTSEQEIVLRNISATQRHVTSTSVSGGFSLVGLYDAAGTTRCATPCPVSPAGQGSTNDVKVKVAFAPGQPGDFQGKLTLYTDDPNAPSLTVTLAGKAQGPLLVFEQPSVDFGRQLVNANPSPTRQVKVINLGNQTFSQTPSVPEPFSVPSQALTVPAGDSRQLTVTFQPTARNTFTGVLSLGNSSVCPTPPAASLKGEAILPAKLLLSRTTMAFPQTVVNTASAPQEVTVTNGGDSLLEVTGLAMDKAPGSAFRVDPSSDFSLAPGETQRLKLTFQPAVSGSATDDLVFTSNDAAAPKLTLSGTATPAATPAKLALSRTAMAFPQTAVDTASAPQEVIVTNEGDIRLDVTGMTLAQGANSAFQIDPSSAFSLAPGGTQRLQVTFLPRQSGSPSDTLSFASNATGAPTLTLSGTSAPGTACLSLAPQSFEFAEQVAGDSASEQKRVVVTNTGTVALTLTPTVTQDGDAYSVSPSTQFTLAPNSAGRELFIKFDPKLNESGSVDGVLSFSTSPATSCVTTVPLHGVARKTSLEVSPTSLTFGDWTVSDTLPTRQVTLKNPTSWPVRVLLVPPETLTPYTLAGIPASGLVVAARSSEVLTVTFAASSWGEAFSRTLAFETDATLPVASVPITGRALAPELTLSSSTLTFPPGAPTGEYYKDTTLTNTGNQALFLSNVTVDNNAHFQVVDFLPQTLPPAGTMSLRIRFGPTTVGDLETRLRFYTTGDRPLPPTLVVKGKSAGPIAIFNKEGINFGPRQVGYTHINSELNVRNSIDASEGLRIVAARVVPSWSEFTVQALTPPQTVIKPGEESESFKITYRPVTLNKESKDSLEIDYEGAITGVTATRRFELKGTGADAQVSAPEGDILFPATLPNTSNPRILTITNSGDVPVELSSVSTTAGLPFQIKVDLVEPIPVKGTRNINVSFNPTAIGVFRGPLEIRLKNSPLVVSLTRTLYGVGASAKLELSENQIFFGEVARLGSSTRSITLRNSGSAPLTVSNVKYAAPFYAQLHSGHFPIILAQDETAQLDITFQPEVAGDQEATLKILSDSEAANELSFKVSGRGTVPLVVFPGGKNPGFAPQAINIEGPRQLIVVKNEGRAPLEIYAVTVPGDFCLHPVDGSQEDGCPKSIQQRVTVLSGTVHSFFVTAKPSKLGSNVSKLSIESNSATTPDEVTLAVEGVGSVYLPTSSVAFGPVNFGAYADQVVLVTNTGIAAAQVSVDFASDSEWRSEFSAQGLPLVVPAGASAPLTLRFQPQVPKGGARSLTATLSTGGTSTQTSLALTLQGTATSAHLNVARRDGAAFDGTLDFGGTRVNTKSDFIGLRLLHASPAGGTGADGGIAAEVGPLTVKDVSLDGEDAKSFILQKPTLPVKLGPGGSMDLSLQFHPDAQRRFNAVLRITSDDNQASTVLVTLSGHGRTNQLSLSTPALDFGARVTESSSAAVRSVRLTNESLQPLKVQGLEILGVAENSEPSHFNVESAPALPFTLAAQESKELFIKFVPRPDVTSKAALTVVTSDLESPVAQVALSGRGISTVFRALSRTLDFGTVRQSETVTTKVVLTNDSTQELLLVQPKVEGPQATNFVVVSPVLGAEGRVLPQGDSLTVELKYDTAQAGVSKGTLVLGTKDQERAALVALSGVTVASFLTIEPMELDLGWVDIGATSTPRTVTLTNQSASPARLSVVENSNPAFQIDASALDAELAPGAQATVNVTFQGQVGGPAEGTLKLRLRGETTTEAQLVLKGQARTLGGTGGGCACGTSGDGGAALALLLLLGLGLGRQARRMRVED